MRSNETLAELGEFVLYSSREHLVLACETYGLGVLRQAIANLGGWRQGRWQRLLVIYEQVLAPAFEQ